MRLAEQAIWSIGTADLIDNYKAPAMPGEVVWRVPHDGSAPAQRWPLFHPSEADPDGGYRLYPYAIEFDLDHEPSGAYALSIDYLVIAPRLANLEIRVNGASGRAYLRPAPSQGGEIRLLAGLHTTIYAEGLAEIAVPAELLRHGQNRIELISRDDGDTIMLDNIEAIRRLDRMANGAGFVYQRLALVRRDRQPQSTVARIEIKPTVVYRTLADGSLVERCHVYVELSRPIEAARLTLTLHGDERSERIELPLPTSTLGHLRHTFDLFDGDGPVRYTIEGAIDGEPIQQRGTFQRRRKWNVYLTPHAHTDIGYTHRQWEVAERLCRNIDKALDLLTGESDATDQPPPFSYHLDSTWVLESWLATRGERRRQQLNAQIRAGRISLPHGYVDLLTHYAALEDLIRNGEFTEAVLRPIDRHADFATVVDVASLTGALPAILEGSGVKYLVHANNQDRGPFRLNGGLHRISPFRWQGTHGGSVLVWLAKMYCELRKVCGSPPVLSSAERGLDLWLDEYETEAYAPDAVLLYGQEADNTDIDPQPIDFVRQWNAAYAYPRLIACDISSFFRYIEDHFGDRLHTVRGDGGAYWEDGIGSAIVPTMAVRRAQAMLPAAERLEALAAIHNHDLAYPARAFGEAWRDVLLYDEHTWGAFLSCRDPEALLQQDQWAVKQHMADAAAQWATRLLHSAATRHSLSWNNNGREVVVYNPHSWPISDVVRVEIDPRETVLDATTGDPVPARRVATLETQAIVDLWVERLPGLSYRRFVLRESAAPDAGITPEAIAARSAVLENDHYRLEFDLQRGCLASWIDRALGRELVDRYDAWGFGQLLYVRGGENTRIISNQADLPEATLDVLNEWTLIDSAVARFDWGSSLTLRGTVPYGTLEAEWTLHDRDRRINVRYSYTKQERREKEAVYIAFPLALPDATIRSDAQLGWVDWDRDALPGGCKEWLPLQTGVLVEHPGATALISSPDIPLFCVGDVVRGRWPKQLRLRGNRVLSYVLNNYWHTNYKASQGGPISFRYRLTSDRSIAPDRAFRLGWAARQGLYAQRMSYQDFRDTRATYAQPGGGTLAQIGPEQIALSALKRARWADGWIVRVHEIGGAARTATIAFPGQAIARAWITDLLERDGDEIAVGPDGTVRIEVAAWSLATVRVVLRNEAMGKDQI